MVFNKYMNTSIKKKLRSSNPEINSVSPKTKKSLWYHEIEGSGQRKRYLRSLKEEAAIKTSIPKIS